MKNKSLTTRLFALIALVMTAHISYGQSKQDSTDQYSIKQSLKCFEEQKGLKVIIEQKDSINITLNKYAIATKDTLTRAVKDAIKVKNIAEKKSEKLQKSNSLLKTIAVIEGVLVVLLIIFK